MTAPRRAGWTRVTTVIRLFDLRLASNRFVIVASPIALALVAIAEAVQGSPVGTAVSRGVQAGLTVFLSWAVARELRPDDALPAAVASGLAFLLVFSTPVALGPTVALLFAIRVTARTTGASPTGVDLLWLPGLALYAARVGGGFLWGLGLAAALAIDAWHPRRYPALVSAGSAAVLAVGGALRFGTLAPDPTAPTALGWAALAVTAVSIPALRGSPTESTGDLDGRPLSPARVAAAQTLAMGMAAATVAWIGGSATVVLLPLMSAVVGVALRRAAGALSATWRASFRGRGTDPRSP